MQMNNFVFESEYINFAWGYVHSGYLIDRSGNVYTYDIHQQKPPVNKLDVLQLKQRLSPDVIKQLLHLLDCAQHDTLINLGGYAYDMGGNSYYAYVNGQRIKLSSRGNDGRQEMRSACAQKLIDQLRQIK